MEMTNLKALLKMVHQLELLLSLFCRDNDRIYTKVMEIQKKLIKLNLQSDSLDSTVLEDIENIENLDKEGLLLFCKIQEENILKNHWK